MNVVNLNEKITEIARELYEKSGRVQGHDLDNWLEAEKIVMARYREQEKLGAKKLTPKEKAVETKKSIQKAIPKIKKTKA